jgi:hypothetical protein
MRGGEVKDIDEVERSGIEKVMVDSETCDMR